MLDQLKRDLLAEARETGEPVAEVLARLVRECLMSDDADPCHVDGVEFIRTCDSVLVLQR